MGLRQGQYRSSLLLLKYAPQTQPQLHLLSSNLIRRLLRMFGLHLAYLEIFYFFQLAFKVCPLCLGGCFSILIIEKYSPSWKFRDFGMDLQLWRIFGIQYILIMEEIVQLAIQWIANEGTLRMIQHLIVVVVIARFITNLLRIESRGKLGLFSYITKIFLRLGGRIGYVKDKKEKYLEEESTKSAEETLGKKEIKLTYAQLPQKGLARQEILATLDKRIRADIDPTEGKTFAYVYQHSKQHSEVTEACFVKYLHSNALNPIMFNSLRVIENEVIRMVATLFHGDENSVGNITSCGTESLLLAMKTYRDYRGTGDVIMCTTGHPAINKGCHYVGLNVVQIPYDQKKRMSLSHLKRAISSKTVVVVCSAPQYPNGVVDDVPEIAKICQSYGVPLHVDAAIGGFVLPFIEMEGKAKFKPFDFRVEGVSSINADVHKYGYAPKGSSVLIYRNSKIRRNQYFSFATWPGGIYISPTALGTRNGGCLSAAWGSLLDLGIDGFRKITAQVLLQVQKFVQYLKTKPELELLAEPDSTIISFRCRDFSCYKLADALEAKGLFVQKQSNPESIHMTLMPSHIGKIQGIIDLINICLVEIQANPSLYDLGSKAVYGMMAKIPDQAITQDFVVHYMDKIYKFK